MTPRPPRSTRTDTLFPYTTLFLSRNGRTHRVPLFAEQVPEDHRIVAIGPVGVADLGRALREGFVRLGGRAARHRQDARSEEHTSELQSLMRISYAVFCLKKKKTSRNTRHTL